MKNVLLLIFALGIFSTAYAQNVPFTDEMAEQTPIYADLIKSPRAKLKDIQRAFKLYESKHPGKYKQYHRWESRARLQVKADGTIMTASEVEKAYYDFKREPASRSVSSNWVEEGPITLPTNLPSQPNGLGRINEIAFGPSNSNTIYVGTPAAGLWKSTDGGSNWASNTDNLPSLGVSAIVVDKDDANTIYIGTGDRDGNDSAGKGVMKSTDGGNTFTAINSGILSYEYINDLIQDPNNGDVMIAAGYFKSIYRTSNGGASWSTVSNPSPSDAVLSLAFKPG
ncbi:MAG TPA: hypothetical protein ENK85_11520, partial [Saprospiraceae bacterium]|nr:hypothetical protein [Saprospiraceae bacterium]